MVDLKSTVILRVLAFLLTDVLVDHLVGDGTGGHSKIAPRPEVAAPVLFLEMGEFLKQLPSTRSLKPLHDLADVLVRSIADEYAHMIGRNLARDDLQLPKRYRRIMRLH